MARCASRRLPAVMAYGPNGGVKASELRACAELTLTDPATMTNPRAVTSMKQVMEVYEQAL